jgi:hypothetical protein
MLCAAWSARVGEPCYEPCWRMIWSTNCTLPFVPAYSVEEKPPHSPALQAISFPTALSCASSISSRSTENSSPVGALIERRNLRGPPPQSCEGPSSNPRRGYPSWCTLSDLGPKSAVRHRAARYVVNAPPFVRAGVILRRPCEISRTACWSDATLRIG